MKAVSASTTPAVEARSNFWARLNKERVARHLAPLTWDGRLSEYGQRWSKEMADSGQFKHSHIGDLLGRYDYVGENISRGSPGVSTRDLHVGLMHSQAHRDNMLAVGFTRAGIGVYCRDHSMWMTTVFGRLASQGPPSYNPPTSEYPIVATRGGKKC